MQNYSMPTILVVGHDESTLETTEHLLRHPGVTILTARSGDEARELLFEHDFALIILDVEMPDLDGFEAAHRVHGSSGTRQVPIILISAADRASEPVVKGYEAGAIDYLFKPLNPAILKAKVDVFCEMHKQRTLLRRQLAELRTLRGLLPVCSCCKRIRNDKGYWDELEVYLQQNTDAKITHGYCPECLEKLKNQLEASDPKPCHHHRVA